MGLHTGEPSVGTERYVGLGVHRAARIGAAGHGGQVLLSNATRELVEEELYDVVVRELGLYRLKDIDAPSGSTSSTSAACRGVPAAEGREGRAAAALALGVAGCSARSRPQLRSPSPFPSSCSSSVAAVGPAPRSPP